MASQVVVIDQGKVTGLCFHLGSSRKRVSELTDRLLAVHAYMRGQTPTRAHVGRAMRIKGDEDVPQTFLFCTEISDWMTSKSRMSLLFRPLHSLGAWSCSVGMVSTTWKAYHQEKRFR